MTNIDDFNRGVALILGALYQKFPVPCDLNIEQLNTHDGISSDDIERRKDRINIYSEAVVFLREEGFISEDGFFLNSDKTFNRQIYVNVVLTSKGMVALQKYPKEFRTGHQKTMGDIFTDFYEDFLKYITKDLLKVLISELLTQ